MKHLAIITIITLLLSNIALADHGPRLQFIHNTADEALTQIDLWVSYPYFPASKYVENWKYKEATSFDQFGLIYGNPTIYLTPVGSSDTSEYFLKKTLNTIDYDEKYVVVLSGDLTTSLDLILTDGLDTQTSNNYTSVKFFHGSVGAPAVNVEEISIPIGSVFENVQYGEDKGYKAFAPNSNIWKISTNTGAVIGEFPVPLNFFSAIPVFVAVTGYADTTGPTSNNPLGLIAVNPDGTVFEIAPSQGLDSPRLQVIHNSAAEIAEMVDIWLSDGNGSVKLLENFGYKESTPYIDAPTAFTVSVTLPGSVDTTNAVIHKNFVLVPGEEYIVIAAGDPGNNFDLFATDGKETVSTAGKTDIKVFHGSVGAPVVDIDEVSLPAGILIDNLGFGESQGFLTLEPLDYNLQILTQEGIAAAEFEVPLSLFEDETLLVLATGYLDTTGTVPNNPFKLLAVTAIGNVVELDPLEVLTPAKIQIIHNSPTPALQSVDIYLNTNKILDDFGFRNSTSFIEVPGATSLTVDIDVSTSIDNSFPVFSEDIILSSGRDHIIIASGVVVFGGENYFPQRDFELIKTSVSRESSLNPDNVDVLVHHGSTDVTTVNINETTIPVVNLVENLEYGSNQGYFELDAGTYELQIELSETGQIVNTYYADLSGLENKAVTILASGFLSPVKNNNGPDLGLWMSFPEGGPLVELTNVASVDDPLSNDISMLVYPNPVSQTLNLDLTGSELSEIELYFYDMAGNIIKSEVRQTNSGSTMQIPVNELSSGLYILKVLTENSIISKKVQVFN